MRPDGEIVVTSWSGTGLFGQIRQALAPHFPDAPEPWHERPDLIRSLVGPKAEVVERSFTLTTASPEVFVTQLETQSAPFIVGARSLGDRWYPARADLLAAVASAGETSADGYRAQVGYLITTIPAG